MAKDWNAKPGFKGWRGERGEVDECATWIILWGEGWEDEAVEEIRCR